MTGKKFSAGLEGDIRGLKDPGITLIVVYISIIILLLLFSGLKMVHADTGNIEMNMLTTDTCPEGIAAGKKNTPAALSIPPRNIETSRADRILKKTIPSEFFFVLGITLLFLALLLAKDGKNH